MSKKEEETGVTTQPEKPGLSKEQIESRYQEHLRRVAGPAKVGGK